MNDEEGLSPLQRAALAVRTLRLRLDRLEQERREPIAIVGLGCRLPGAESPEAFWALLREGRDAVGDWPADRWDVDRLFDADADRAGRIYTRHGAFLPRVDEFDAAFFNVPPREAERLDPQQRLLLEVAWEAFEHAGVAPDRLRESRTGVFVGIGQNDYARRGLLAGDPARIGAYDGTGNGLCFASGRLSYVFGLQGPNLAIDTACSSSLVALHTACQSLRQRECDLALAGGVQLILSPEITLFLSRARALSPDGRCRTFDAEANGFGRGEGCGLVVLKRVSDARRDGDRVLALVRGSAVNHDGPSSGLTAPNADAQRRVIEDALAAAALDADAIDAVEAHGTATALGDPLEVAGLAQVFARRAPHLGKVRLASVKTNVGHLEAAAGIVGVIKMVLALLHDELPPHLNCRTPTRAVDWDRVPLRVVTSREAWPRTARPRVAGVSAFGISGTNAHVVLEEAPLPAAVQASSAAPAEQAYLLPLSAQSAASLEAARGRFAACLEAQPADSWPAVCHTAGVRRTHLTERLCVVARDARSAASALRAAADAPGDLPVDPPAPLIVRGRAATPPPKIAFVFSGQGVQAAGMGRELFLMEPRFREAVEACATAVADDLDTGLLDVLYGDAGARIDEPVYTQLGLYAVSCGLAALWRAWGVEPWAVAGHSVGEYAAAVTARVFDLATGAKLIVRRATRMSRAPGPGAMAAIGGAPAKVAAAVAGTLVDIAAWNAPESTVIAGEAGALADVCRRLAAGGHSVTPLRVAHAYHSRLMDPALDGLRGDLAGLRAEPPRVRFVSTVTGQRVTTELTTADYWVKQVRSPVRFAEAVGALRESGCTLFVEIGPGRTLTTLGSRSARDAAWIAGLPATGPGDHQRALGALAAAWVRGVAVDWSAVSPGTEPRRVATLPAYAWNRTRYWLETPDAAAGAPAIRPGLRAVHSPLARRELEFEASIDPSAPFLADHRVDGRALVPAAAWLDLAAAAAALARPGWQPTLEDVRFEAPLFVSDGTALVRVVLAPREDAGYTFAIHAAPADALRAAVLSPSPWRRHAAGVLSGAGDARAMDRVSIEAIRARTSRRVAPGEVEARLRSRGLALGASYGVLDEIWQNDDEVLARLGRAPDPRWAIDPAIVDGASALHVLLEPASAARLVQSRFGRVTRDGSLEGARWVWVRRDRVRGLGAVAWLDETGATLLSIADQEWRALPSRRAASDDVRPGPRRYELTWRAIEAVAATPWKDVTTDIETAVEEALASPDCARWSEEEGRLDALASALGARALAVLDGSLDRGAILPKYQRLTARLREIGDAAQPAAVAAAAGAGLEAVAETRSMAAGMRAGVARALDRSGSAASIDGTGGHRFGAAALEAAVVERCGAQLPEVLTGRVDPLALLFPADGVSAASLYRDTSPARAMNAAMASAVDVLMRPAVSRRLRVLEVGAGHGATTERLLARLPEDCEYWFTDVAPVFVRQAATRFAGDDRVRACRFDMERPAAEQSLHGPFDLIVAANVLHAARSLEPTLARLRRLLAPGGALLALENTEPHAWVDIIFGLTEGWWNFEDVGLRPAHPLIGASAWSDVLHAAGFEQAAVVPGAARAALAGQRLLIARAPGAHAAAAALAEWLVVGDETPLTNVLAARLTHRSGRPVRVVNVSGLETSDRRDAVIRAALDALPAADPVGLVSLAPAAGIAAAEADDLPARAHAAAQAALSLMQAVQAGPKACRVWFVTQGIDTGVEEGLRDAPVRGLARALAVEEPERFGGLIDLDPAMGAGAMAESLSDALLGRAPGGDEIACRGQARLTPQLTPSRPASSPPGTLGLDGCSVLITGGLGAAGLATAEHLARRGARHLHLLGRHGVTTGRARQAIADLERAGAHVDVIVADVCDKPAMAAAVARIEASSAPLRGVVHAAGVTGYGPISDTTADALRTILRPKVDGAWVLHQVTRGLPLDWFVLYSSMVAVWGAPHQAPYVAANQFLDALAHYRRAAGLPAVSIDWGPLAGGGMTPEAIRDDLERVGVHLTPLPDAIAGLDALIAGDGAQALYVDIDWPRFAGLQRARRSTTLFDALDTTARSVSPPIVPPRAAAAGRDAVLAALPGERQELIAALVSELVAQLVVTSGPIPRDTGLFALGLDSLGAMELRRALEQRFERTLPSTVLFDCPTIDALAAHLHARLVGAEPVAAAPPAGDGLDEAELEARLLRKLDELG